MQDFRRIRVWQRAHALVLRIYAVSRAFPREELYGLTSQMRGASISIAANIAEGAGRGGQREFPRFLDIASGSASELEYYLLLAYDLGLLAGEHHEAISAELAQIKRMLAGLIRTIRTSYRDSQNSRRRRPEPDRIETENSEPTTDN